MKEEDIDNRIERVIKSVASKKADMAQWEQQSEEAERKRKVAFRRWRTYGLSAAASVAVVCCIGISLFVTRDRTEDMGVASSVSIYRGGSSDIAEIQAMIDSAKYETALQAIDATLADTIIDQSFTQERQDYLRSLNANREYELLWLKINVLIKSDNKHEAITLLKEYVKADGEYRNEAIRLLNDLTE